jgi:hypothetical protein
MSTKTAITPICVTAYYEDLSSKFEICKHTKLRIMKQAYLDELRKKSKHMGRWKKLYANIKLRLRIYQA